MKLYVLNAGEMICTDGSQLSDAYAPDSTIPLANPIFLIAHPKGFVLWDTGLSDHIAATENGVQNWIFHLQLKKTVKRQLADLNIRPEDIDYLAFSHMHIDHTGNANYFRSSTLVMQEAEYKVAFQEANKPMNYDDYKDLASSRVIKLQGDHDLFGDGSVVLLSTPGHTPGHQSLMLRLAETGTVIISGDVSYTLNHYQQKGVPSFNTDQKDTIASIQKIERLVKQENATLWIQHDSAQFKALRLAPACYQ